MLVFPLQDERQLSAPLGEGSARSWHWHAQTWEQNSLSASSVFFISYKAKTVRAAHPEAVLFCGFCCRLGAKGASDTGANPSPAAPPGKQPRNAESCRPQGSKFPLGALCAVCHSLRCVLGNGLGLDHHNSLSSSDGTGRLCGLWSSQNQQFLWFWL